TLSTDIRFDGAENDEALVYFRMSDDMKTGYAASLTRTGVLRLFEVNNIWNRAGYNLKIAETHLLNFDPDVFNTLMITVVGGAITVRVNGYANSLTDNVTKYIDRLHTRIGVGTYAMSGAVWFDNVSLGDTYAAREDFTLRSTYGSYIYDVDGDLVPGQDDEDAIIGAIAGHTYDDNYDLDGDYDVDYSDLYLLRRDFISSAEVSAKVLGNDLYYLSRDLTTGLYRVEANAAEAGPSYNDTDAGKIFGVSGRDYWLNNTIGTLAEVELLQYMRSDLDGNQSVTETDFNTIFSSLGSCYLGEQKAKDRIDGSGWTQDGDYLKCAGGTDGKWASYAITTPVAGVYNIGMYVKNDIGTLPSNYKYYFNIEVDGKPLSAQLIVQGSDSTFLKGTLNMALDAGQHFIKFIWSNASSLATSNNCVIQKIEAGTASYTAAADVTGPTGLRDNKVDMYDLQMFMKQYADSGMIQKIDTGASGFWYVIKIPELGRYYFYHEGEQAFVESSADGTVTINTTTYRIKETEDGSVRLLPSADFNGDGIVNAADRYILDSALGSSAAQEVLANAYSTSQTHGFDGPTAGNHNMTENYVTNASTAYWLGYELNNVPAGTYNIGLFARGYNKQAFPMSGFAAYRFKVYIDGIEYGEFTVNADRERYQEGFLTVNVKDSLTTNTRHNIRFVWTNPEKGLHIDIDKIFVRDIRYSRGLDLDDSGSITSVDQAIFDRYRVNIAATAKISLGGHDYYATVRADKTILLTDTEDPDIFYTNTVADGNEIHIDRAEDGLDTDFKYFYDDNTGAILLTETYALDYNGDGILDSHDDEYFIAAMNGETQLVDGFRNVANGGTNYGWQRGDLGSITTRGKNYLDTNPYIAYEITVPEDGNYDVGLTAQNVTSQDKANNWTNPCEGAYLAVTPRPAEGSAGMECGNTEYDATDGSVKITPFSWWRSQGGASKPQLAFCNDYWPDGSGKILEIPRGLNHYVEFKYKFNGDDVPGITTARVFWTINGTEYHVDVPVNVTGTYTNDINDGAYHTYIVDLYNGVDGNGNSAADNW
ncbi:MAG: hypothetical protein PHT32_08260, partial [Candidatus Omnitrophica bacterium]|nr:hypothetical protein [Candidatus Omnitrophota bacterium]